MNPAGNNVKILFAEDLPADAELARREIKKGGIDFIYKVVETEPDFRKELNEFNPDIVVSDYSMPTFDGMLALTITRKLSPFLPFIILTGSMNEETAVACMKAGANDYVIKEQITRLPFAVAEALAKSQAKLEKDQMQKQLHENEAMYRSLIENSSDAIYLLNEGKFEIINAEFSKLFGYSFEELNQPGFDYNNLVAPESRPFLEERRRRVLHGEKVDNRYVFTALLKSGKKREVEASVSYINFKGGTATQGIIHDITERKKVEDQLRFLSKAVEQNPIAIEITDPKGNIEYVNPAFTRITGYSYEEAVGKNPRILQSGHHTKNFYENLWNTILSGNDWEGEFLNKKKNGENYWEEAIISSIHDEKGNIIHFIGVKENITEKKKIIEELIQAKEKAEESDRLKSAFLANMSHEVRTPMNGIMGFSELLKEPKLRGKEKNQYIKIIQKSGQRMLSTINDLIEISKIESGSLELKLSEVNINGLLDYLYNFFHPETENRGLSFKLHKALSDEQAILETDQEKLNGVLMNLIKNAIKFTNLGEIEMGYRLLNNTLEFFVKDTGIGIEEKHRKIIFDRFAQADISLSKPYEGAGLGLSIAKAYVEMLGGKIWLQSELQKGTQFFFSIPFVQEQSKKQ